LIVFEATGAYHRSLEKFLNLHRLPYVKVNPKQARRFAQAVGKLAKTDRVDAEMLARMGSALDLQAKEQPHESSPVYRSTVLRQRTGLRRPSDW